MNQTGEFKGVCPLCYVPVKAGEDSRTLQLERNGQTETYHGACIRKYLYEHMTEAQREQSVGLSILEQYQKLIIGHDPTKREDWIADNQSEWFWKGLALKSKRDEYGVTLKFMADVLGVSQSRLKRFEAGEPVRDAKLLYNSYILLFSKRELEQEYVSLVNFMQNVANGPGS